MEEKKYYKNVIENITPKPRYLRNMLNAFLYGGAIGLIGECIRKLYMWLFDFSTSEANSLMIATLIIIAAFLTGFGIYDKIGQKALCGTIVPITGFANSMTSSALEYRSEGIVLGIASNLFKLAGSVICFSVIAAYIVGIIKMLVMLL